MALGNTAGGKQLNLILSEGVGGSPTVEVSQRREPGPACRCRATISLATAAILNSFQALPAGFTGGVTVDVADVNNDGVADIVCGAGPGGSPQVTTFNPLNGNILSSFFALNPSFTGGVFV